MIPAREPATPILATAPEERWPALPSFCEVEEEGDEGVAVFEEITDVAIVVAAVVAAVVTVLLLLPASINSS